MRYELEFYPSLGYVCIRTHGNASVTGFARLIEEVADSPDWTPDTGLLIDHRRLKPGRLSVDEMDQIKDLVKEKKPIVGNGRCAFLVGNQLGFGLARMYELVGGDSLHSAIKVFYSEDEALEWLTGNEARPRTEE